MQGTVQKYIINLLPKNLVIVWLSQEWKLFSHINVTRTRFLLKKAADKSFFASVPLQIVHNKNEQTLQ